MKYAEPADRTLVLIAHPYDKRPERVFYRDDAAAEESGYGGDTDDSPTWQRWYEIAEDAGAPSTWEELAGDDSDGPILALAVGDELPAAPPTFFDRRAAQDPSIDHASHSQQWVGRCLECSPDDQAEGVER